MQRIWPLLLLVLLCLFPTICSAQYIEYYASDGDDYYNRSQSVNYISNDSDSTYSHDYSNAFPSYADSYRYEHHPKRHYSSQSSKHIQHRLAQKISPPGEKVVIVDPNVHRFGAYDAEGNLLHEGMVSAGSSWCRDLGRSCRTSIGTFRVRSLGDSDCISRKFPLGRGGAPMPYCMYFNNTQALHGSYEVANANISHGCVRMRVNDAEWLRFNFVKLGTKVIIRPY